MRSVALRTFSLEVHLPRSLRRRDISSYHFDVRIVDSWLPYEGRLLLANKRAHTAFVRAPRWLHRKSLEAFLNDKSVPVVWGGNRAIFSDLKPGDTIRLECEVPEYTERRTIYGKEYTMTFRGSTLIDINPRETIADPESGSYEKVKVPIYQRDQMKAKTAPMIEKRRFVAKNVLPLQ